MDAPISLITGANKGIGYHTAALLGARGHTVLLGCRDPQRAAEAENSLCETGADAHALVLDVTDDSSIQQAAEQITERYQRLDVLVNNAGIAGAAIPKGESTPDALRRMLETNVVGPVAMIEAMLPLLHRSPAGRIVNVSSEVGSIGSTLDPISPLWQMPVGIPYPTSKTALNMVTAMYAKRLWDTPIKVNAANPGYCATDLNGHTGFRTPEQGAQIIEHLATLGDDGATGKLWGHLWTNEGTDDSGVLPW